MIIILNNVQLEGRRINVEISKNDGGGRRDHNGRSSGGLSAKSFFHSYASWSVDLEFSVKLLGFVTQCRQSKLRQSK